MMKSLKKLAGVVASALLVASVAFAANAQTTTKYEIKAGTVVSVWDNHLVAKDADGVLTHYEIPAGQKFIVDGKEVTIKDLKPGTKLGAIIETKTSPYTVVEETLKNATVVSAAGDALTVKNETGVKTFIVAPGFRFGMQRGKVKTEQLMPGDKLNATFIRKVEGTKTEQKAVIAGEAPKPAPAAPVAAPAPPPPAPVAAPAPPPPAPAPAVAEKPKKLPKTGSPLPLAALAGVLSLASGLALRTRRSA